MNGKQYIVDRNTGKHVDRGNCVVTCDSNKIVDPDHELTIPSDSDHESKRGSVVPSSKDDSTVSYSLGSTRTTEEIRSGMLVVDTDIDNGGYFDSPLSEVGDPLENTNRKNAEIIKINDLKNKLLNALKKSKRKREKPGHYQEASQLFATTSARYVKYIYLPSIRFFISQSLIAKSRYEQLTLTALIWKFTTQFITGSIAHMLAAMLPYGQSVLLLYAIHRIYKHYKNPHLQYMQKQQEFHSQIKSKIRAWSPNVEKLILPQNHSHPLLHTFLRMERKESTQLYLVPYYLFLRVEIPQQD